ncbi:hypothetical protein [Spirosoma luteum]|uniref:hypothetical protein n=1 Tax=Spirosoma luteum TaxID=431553 RepID=UPI0003694172|nr:hypothetical protein [Spirosoma luteum]
MSFFRSFLFRPTQSWWFYLAIFLGLIGIGLKFEIDLNTHYGVIGSVASFLAFFVAFQSWKASEDTSRKTDQALDQMHQVLAETSRLAQQNYAIDQQIRGAVATISDATRELFRGYRQILTEVRDFLDGAANSECIYIITDTAAIGKLQAGYNPQLQDAKREYKILTDRIHDLLTTRIRDSREFYFASLDPHPDAPHEPGSSSLYSCYVEPVWRTIHPREPLPEEVWHEQQQLHQACLREIEDTFTLFSDHHQQRDAGVPVLHTLESLPLQLLIRVDLEASEPFKALVIFVGQYNMNKVTDARAMLTADPELVRTFISMFESITGLDMNKNYASLRKRLPI